MAALHCIMVMFAFIFSFSEVRGYCLERHKSLLLNFKHSLVIDESDYGKPSKLANWNSSTDCCLWPGVTCSDTFVTGLDLSNEGIFGGFNDSSPLFDLTSLTSLKLATMYQDTIIPSGIGRLVNLMHLDISGSLFIGQIPIEVSNLTRLLEELNANFNKLTQLPDTMGFELTNLKKLSVNSNKLDFLPRSTSYLSSLRILDARLNCLRSLPDDLENLINLQVLNVSQNFHYLRTLPYSVGLLFSLTDLDVSYNKIMELPHSIGCLKKLQRLSVEGNPLVCPSMEVVEQGVSAVKEYLSDKMNETPTKRNKASWISKLKKYGTFSASTGNRWVSEERQAFVMPDYRSIDGLVSPRRFANVGMFSPRRLFSPKTYFSRD